MTRFKLIAELERDICNQVVIDQMKKLTPEGKLMVLANRNLNYVLLAGILGSILIWALLILGITRAFSTECPTPGEPCRVILLSPQEEKLLMSPNGILDTAAQARALDLGQFSVYLKTRISGAPQGEVKPVSPPAENKPVAPVDSTPK